MEEFNINNIPEEYRPLGMWQYFGYQILYAIPIIGIIVLLIHAFGGTKNVNLKNFARSYFCAIIVGIVILVLMLIGGGFAAILGN